MENQHGSRLNRCPICESRLQEPVEASDSCGVSLKIESEVVVAKAFVLKDDDGYVRGEFRTNRDGGVELLLLAPGCEDYVTVQANRNFTSVRIYGGGFWAKSEDGSKNSAALVPGQLTVSGPMAQVLVEGETCGSVEVRSENAAQVVLTSESEATVYVRGDDKASVGVYDASDSYVPKAEISTGS